MDDQAIRSWPIPRDVQWFPHITRRWLSGLPDQREALRHVLHRLEHSSESRSFTSHVAFLIERGVLSADMSVDEAARTMKAMSKSGDLPYRDRQSALSAERGRRGAY